MSALVLPALVALFAWWFSTGIILLLDQLPRRTYRWTLLGATVVLAGALWGLWASAGVETAGGAYAAFVSALLAWGFLEITFLTGLLTGPRKQACPPDCRGWRHFRHGVEVILYHEIAIILAAAVVLALTWGEPNGFGAWAFMILWVMRQSSKLNLFLGVRNLSEDFLPEHLRYLAAFFRRRPMNFLFPVSITGATLGTAWLTWQALAADSAFAATGYGLLAALMALALLEHWLLVLPLRAETLWGFALRARQDAALAGKAGAATPAKPWSAQAVPLRTP